MDGEGSNWQALLLSHLQLLNYARHPSAQVVSVSHHLKATQPQPGKTLNWNNNIKRILAFYFTVRCTENEEWANFWRKSSRRMTYKWAHAAESFPSTRNKHLCHDSPIMDRSLCFPQLWLPLIKTLFETRLTFSHIVINLSKMQREFLQILQIKKKENESVWFVT